MKEGSVGEQAKAKSKARFVGDGRSSRRKGESLAAHASTRFAHSLVRSWRELISVLIYLIPINAFSCNSSRVPVCTRRWSVVEFDGNMAAFSLCK